MFQHLFSDEPDSAARTFWYSSVVWFVFGTSVGLLASVYFVWPDVMRGVPWLSFGRLRPIHVNVVALAWLSMAQLGSMYYILPRLLRTRLWSERLANFTAWAWNGTLLLGVITLLLGYTEGKEYAELCRPIDILVLVALLLNTLNVTMTVAQRREPLLYVSVWYFLGTVFWYPVIYFLGNRTFFATAGLNDAIVGWFYGHNTLGLWFTTMGIGATYYLLPRLVNKPIYSHLLSLIGFWTVAIFYAPIGAHHTLQAPIPEWLKAIASTSSALMVIPVVTVLVNFFKTMDGEWHQVPGNTPLKFLTMAMICYLVTCIQGPLQASRAINSYLHFSQWVVGHAHMALLGTFTFIQVAFIYYALPRVLKRPIYSERIANIQFWCSVLGFGLMFVVLTVAGLQQAAGWGAQISVQYASLWLKPMYFLRTISGIILVGTFIMFAYNIYMTVRGAYQQQAGAGLEPVA